MYKPGHAAQPSRPAHQLVKPAQAAFMFSGWSRTVGNGIDMGVFVCHLYGIVSAFQSWFWTSSYNF